MSQPKVIKVFVQSKWWNEEVVAWEVAGTFNFWINNRELILSYLDGIKTGEQRSNLFQPINLN